MKTEKAFLFTLCGQIYISQLTFLHAQLMRTESLGDSAADSSHTRTLVLYRHRKLNSYLYVTHKMATEYMAWASYQIRKIAGCACAGNAGNVFPRHRFQRKPLVSDPGMHHGTCVTHVPWCMLGSLTCGDGENVPGIPGSCAPAILRIWQEAHSGEGLYNCYQYINESGELKRDTSSLWHWRYLWSSSICINKNFLKWWRIQRV